MALEIKVGPPLVTISNGQTVLVSEPDGQIYPDFAKGLYFLDTRLAALTASWRTVGLSTCWIAAR